ncbi:MAG TPA: SH3 domain-containing protein, partial [Geminicoccaceae bacterium]|nr:SH3 domain-containing protein [Geminicoccaceae bacterium]
SYAAIRAVNVRAAPSNAADVLAVVAQGDVVRRIGNQGGWLRVEYDDRRGGDVTGWVHGQHLRRVGAPSAATGPSARADD